MKNKSTRSSPTIGASTLPIKYAVKDAGRVLPSTVAAKVQLLAEAFNQSARERNANTTGSIVPLIVKFRLHTVMAPIVGYADVPLDAMLFQDNREIKPMTKNLDSRRGDTYAVRLMAHEGNHFLEVYHYTWQAEVEHA